MPPIIQTETPAVVLASDFANIGEDASGTEVNIVRDEDGAMRLYVPATGGGGVLRCYFQANAGVNLALSDHPSTIMFLANNSRNIQIADLGGYTECRLSMRVVTASASVNTPRIVAQYSASYTTTIGDYADIGASEVSVSLSSAGFGNSGWSAMAEGAIADDIYIVLAQIGGDGAADPAIAGAVLEFR
jgi:hypothetical protein